MSGQAIKRADRQLRRVRPQDPGEFTYRARVTITSSDDEPVLDTEIVINRREPIATNEFPAVIDAIRREVVGHRATTRVRGANDALKRQAESALKQ